MNDQPTSFRAWLTALTPKERAALFKKLALYAHWKLHRRSWEKAEDLAQQAIADLLEREDARPGGEPSGDPAFLSPLLARIQNLAKDWEAKKSTRAEIPHAFEEEEDRDPGFDEPMGRASSAATPEEAYAEREYAELARRRVAARVAGDAGAKQIFGCFCEGFDTPSEQVERTGMSKEEVRYARERLFRHLDAVRRELEEEGT